MNQSQYQNQHYQQVTMMMNDRSYSNNMPQNIVYYPSQQPQQQQQQQQLMQNRLKFHNFNNQNNQWATTRYNNNQYPNNPGQYYAQSSYHNRSNNSNTYHQQTINSNNMRNFDFKFTNSPNIVYGQSNVMNSSRNYHVTNPNDNTMIRFPSQSPTIESSNKCLRSSNETITKSIDNSRIPVAGHLKYSSSKNSNCQMKFNDNVHLRQALGFTNAAKNNPSAIDNRNIIENTKPVFKKIKRVNLDSRKINVRKIFMSLESGLLAETTYAFDCLNIMSFNGHLKLNSCLLNCLLDYFKYYLMAIFEDFFIDEESEIYRIDFFERDWNYNEEKVVKKLKTIHENDRIHLLNDSINYTFQSRYGKPVKVKNVQINPTILNIINSIEFNESDYIHNDEKSFRHIIKSMDSERELIPFIRPITGSNIDSNVKIIKQPIGFNKRKYQETIDDEESNENIEPNNLILYPYLNSYESLSKRCLVVSSIIRNASFMTTNCRLMAKNESLLDIISRLLIYGHKHNEKKTFEMIWDSNHNGIKENMRDLNEIFQSNSFEILHSIRMNAFVTLSNLIEQLNLNDFSDKIIIPLIDTLLHWLICPSSYAQDCLAPDDLSIQLQSLEIFSKLSINQSNIDLILAVKPFERIEKMYKLLVEFIGRQNENVLQELSLIVLANFTMADVLTAKIVLNIDSAINNLLSFIESNLESRIRTKAPPLDDSNNDYVLKLAARTLHSLSSVCDAESDMNRLLKYENRIVNLITFLNVNNDLSQILADVLFILSNKKI